jgi:predicted TIM-barrel fold metal-dependent hydrolase
MGLGLPCWAFVLLGFGSPRAPSTVAADHHQHLFSPAVAAPSPGTPVVTAADLVALLDAARIRRAVVLSQAYQFGNPNKPPVENEYVAVKAENDWTSQQVAPFPKRLRAFCGVNPLKEYALDEIARCASDLRLKAGLKLHFGNSDVDLTNRQHVERLRQVFRAANGRGMAIAVHLRSSVTRKRPYGATEARVFLDDVLPSAPDVPVQVAQLAGAGGYDDPLVDEAVGVFVDAVAARDPRVSHLYFDVSGVAGLGEWMEKRDQIAARLRQLGLQRVLYGSDGAVGENMPQRALAAFRQLPLSAAEFQTIEGNVAPYLR